MTRWEIEDQIVALSLDMQRLRDRAGKVWAQSLQQVTDAAHLGEHEQAERWRAVTDAMLAVWLDEGVTIVARLKNAGGVVAQIIDNS